MKKIIAMTTLITAAYGQEVCCEPPIHSSYTYGTIGLGPLPIPAPTFGLGRRIAFGERGAFDVGAEVATLVRINAVKGYANGLLYFKQREASQYYAGLGASVGGIFGPWCFCDGNYGYVAPNLIFGKEFLNSKGNKRFFQVETKYPIFIFTSRSRETLNWGFINLKYGIAF